MSLQKIEYLIVISGYLMIALALLHIIFPDYFNWKKELAGISLINRQMMYVHTIFIALVVLGMGIICITAAADLLQTSLGKKILFSFFIFWCLRLVIQFFGYSSSLWRGKKLETSIHIVFALMWFYFTLVFLTAYIH